MIMSCGMLGFSTITKASVLGDFTANKLFPLLNYLLRFGTRIPHDDKLCALRSHRQPQPRGENTKESERPTLKYWRGIQDVVLQSRPPSLRDAVCSQFAPRRYGQSLSPGSYCASLANRQRWR